jgi:nucleotide-binding universal stress UspA family protein
LKSYISITILLIVVATVFRKILVPLDGSEHSQKALDCAIQIGKKFNSKITLLHVYSIAVPPVLMPEPSTLTQTGVPLPASAEVAKMVEAFRLAGNKILSDAEVQARSAELPVDTLLEEGNAVQEIAKTAKEGYYDLIVIGAKGTHRIKEFLMGNVSEGVLKNTSCPVLVVK